MTLPQEIISGMKILVDEEKDGRINFKEFILLIEKLLDNTLREGQVVELTTDNGIRVEKL